MSQFCLLSIYCLMSVLTLTAQEKIKVSNDTFSLKADTLYVSKLKCKSDYSGAKLVIVESKFFNRDKECSDYSYNLLWQADVNMKMRLIEELLTFESDTTLYCCKIFSYSSSKKKKINDIKSNRYTIQLSALYHINMICFGQFAPFKYSPFPVLYDTEDNCEINENQEKIKEVFQIYKDWFYLNKKENFQNYIFPLKNSKYKWIYGNTLGNERYHGFPIILSDYKLQVGIIK